MVWRLSVCLNDVINLSMTHYIMFDRIRKRRSATPTPVAFRNWLWFVTIELMLLRVNWNQQLLRGKYTTNCISNWSLLSYSSYNYKELEKKTEVKSWVLRTQLTCGPSENNIYFPSGKRQTQESLQTNSNAF